MKNINDAVPFLLASFIIGSVFPYVGLVGILFPPTFIFGALLLAIFFFASKRKYFAPVILSFILFGLALGSWRSSLEMSRDHPDIPEGKTVLMGVIDKEPDIRENYTNQVVRVREIDGVAVKKEFRMILLAPRYPELSYGDRVVATGVVDIPKDFSTDETGRTFHYKEFLEKDGIYARMRYPSIQKTGEHEGNPVVSAFLSVKHSFVDRMGRIYPEPENALLTGLLLGEKRSLGEDITRSFRISGIIHVVVLSGYNMTLVAQYIVAMSRFAGFYGSALLGVAGIFLFTIMAGGGATVVRAAIMASLALSAKLTGRTSEASRLLLFAGAIMVINEPSIVLYDPSFQLSFLATLGLIHGVPFLDARIRYLKKYPVFRDILLSTVATQIFVFPLILYSTGIFPAYALFANLLVLPFVPIAMFFGFWSGVAAFFSVFIGKIIGAAGILFLSWIIWVGRAIADLPFASILVTDFSLPFLFLAYAALAAVILWNRRRTMGPRPIPGESPGS
jgi:competence protein ComEC